MRRPLLLAALAGAAMLAGTGVRAQPATVVPPSVPLAADAAPTLPTPPPATGAIPEKVEPPLARSDGVIKPPAQTDKDMAKTPPQTGSSMPVIPPVGTPENHPEIKPK